MPRRGGRPLRRPAGPGPPHSRVVAVRGLLRRSGRATACHGRMVLQKTRGQRALLSDGKAVIRREAIVITQASRKLLSGQRGQGVLICRLGRGVSPAAEKENSASKGRPRFSITRSRHSGSTVITRHATRYC